MLQFVLPAALLAAAGVLVPILIHLWRPPARTIRLGSLRFLNAVPGRRLRDLRWRDRLLLLVRIALLVALAALLAHPLWVHVAQGPQRWALRSPAAKFDPSAEQVWRDLLAQGYQPRWLAPGFPDASEDGLLPPSTSTDAWSLLREADARVPADSKLAVFAPPLLTTLQGQRPALAHSESTWIPTPADDATTPSTWLQSLSLGRDGRGAHATVGTSNATGTRVSLLLIPAVSAVASLTDQASGATLEFRGPDGAFAGRLKTPKPEPWLPARLWRPVRVAIVHGPARAEDSRYLTAAVRAAAEMADREITVEIREEASTTILPEADWVFRIGTAPLSAPMSRVLAETNVNVVTDAPLDATVDPSPSWFVAPDNAADVNDARLWKRAAAGRDNRTVVWSDGSGAPLLTFAREGRAERWQFLGRFHPDWNDWVRSGAFPGWVRSLVLHDEIAAPESARDRRLADPRQVLPARARADAESVTLSQPADRTSDLHVWIWALSALLLAVERWLSLRAQPVRATAALKSEPRLEEVVQ